MHILGRQCLTSEYWHVVCGYTCSPCKNCNFTYWKFFHPTTLWDAMTVWSSSKMCCWHVGCWLPPKKGCKSCNVLLETDFVVVSTVRRHWSSKRRTLKLYTWRDVIAYRLSNHASTCQRCGFFSCRDYSCYSNPKNALRWTTEPLFVANVGTEHVNAKMTSFWVASREHTPPHILSGS